MDVSIIIVSFNARELLRRSLRSVLGPRPPWPAVECIVIDNASRDGSADVVEREFGAARLVRNGRNVGFAAAVNQGLREAGGRYALLLNPDAELLGDALGVLVRFLDGHRRAGACAPRLLDPDGRSRPGVDGFPTPMGPLLPLLRRLLGRPVAPAGVPRHGEPRRVDTLSGACLMLRRTALESVGLLDERFFLYFEETDLLRRLAGAGWEAWLVPGAAALHVGGGSLGPERAEGVFHGNHPVHWVRSRRRYLRKHHGTAGLVIGELAEVGSHALVWLRHRFRRSDASRERARASALSLRHLLRVPPLERSS